MSNTRKTRASTPEYRSPSQLVLPGFESPFSRELNPDNRWIKLANALPWDSLANIYHRAFPPKSTGRHPLSPRVVIGSVIIKHICHLDDRETVQQISENVYMQYFLGYSSFSGEEPFDASLFVEFRKRLGKQELGQINDMIVGLGKSHADPAPGGGTGGREDEPPNTPGDGPEAEAAQHKGSLLVDATACPQDIAYPTDLGILNDAREKSEELMDVIFEVSGVRKKPRNYRQNARKDYLRTAQKRTRPARRFTGPSASSSVT